MPVQLDLSELLHTPLMRKPFDAEIPCSPEVELECESGITAKLVFTNTGNVLVVQGTASVTLKTRCPRCLTDVVTRVDAPVEESYNIVHEHVAGFADDDDDFIDPSIQFVISGGHLVNVTEMCRQAVILAQPDEPLCRKDCAGLCPQCGADWNKGDCGCEPETESPFAALAGLYKDDAPTEPGADEEEGG